MGMDKLRPISSSQWWSGTAEAPVEFLQCQSIWTAAGDSNSGPSNGPCASAPGLGIRGACDACVCRQKCHKNFRELQNAGLVLPCFFLVLAASSSSPYYCVALPFVLLFQIFWVLASPLPISPSPSLSLSPLFSDALPLPAGVGP